MLLGTTPRPVGLPNQWALAADTAACQFIKLFHMPGILCGIAFGVIFNKLLMCNCFHLFFTLNTGVSVI